MQVDIVGITGRIRFDDNGHRKDYRLDVLELNVDSDPKKVISAVTTLRRFFSS